MYGILNSHPAQFHRLQLGCNLDCGGEQSQGRYVPRQSGQCCTLVGRWTPAWSGALARALIPQLASTCRRWLDGAAGQFKVHVLHHASVASPARPNLFRPPSNQPQQPACLPCPRILPT